MNETKRTSSFWSTFPKLLTGLAAVITAAGTLFAVVPQLAGTAPGRDNPTVAAAGTTSAEPTRTTPAGTTPVPAAETDDTKPDRTVSSANQAGPLCAAPNRPARTDNPIDSDTAKLREAIEARSATFQLLRQVARGPAACAGTRD